MGCPKCLNEGWGDTAFELEHDEHGWRIRCPYCNHASRYYPTSAEANIGFILDREAESHEANRAD